MPGLPDIPGDHLAPTDIGAQGTAGNADSWVCFYCPAAIVVTAVKWIPNAAVTGAATNNFALSLINKGAANAGTAVVTTAKTYDNGVNSVANTPEALTLGATADLNCAAGDVLTLVRTVNGSGLASPDGKLLIFYKFR